MKSVSYEEVKSELESKGFHEIINNFDAFHQDHLAVFVANTSLGRWSIRILIFNSQHILISSLEADEAKRRFAGLDESDSLVHKVMDKLIFCDE